MFAYMYVRAACACWVHSEAGRRHQIPGLWMSVVHRRWWEPGLGQSSERAENACIS